MTHIEKANMIVNAMLKQIERSRSQEETAKECAIVCVDEILEMRLVYGELKYWNRVKKEIKKL